MKTPEITGFISAIDLSPDTIHRLGHDMDRLGPQTATDLSDYISQNYKIDLSCSYAGIEIPHPFGKGAGQLSMSPDHVRSDFENGLAFTVMKSAVGITEDGDVGIDAWEKSAPKMVVEKRRAMDGRDGWTVTWKGRGWDRGFDAYEQFYKSVIGEHGSGYFVVPSLMVDVTNLDRAIEQVKHCMGRLVDTHASTNSPIPFITEIDISPTLNLLPGTENDDTFREFIRNSVGAFYIGLPEPHKFVVKIPNAGRGAEFQVQLIRDSVDEGKDRIAGVIIANRLFDPEGEFEGQRGIAYGGWDLSDANLETLDLLLKSDLKIPLIATGNICSGRMMVEYALRGCMSGEIHTFFQLPPESYRAQKGSGGRVWRSLRELMFHPDDGLIAVMKKLRQSGHLRDKNEMLYFKDLPGIYPDLW